MKGSALFANVLAIAGMVALAQSPRIHAMPQTLVTAQQATDPQRQVPTPKPPTEEQAMQMHQQMMADSHSMDARLESLVTKMNAAKGDAKVEAMAAVISALVQQRTMMRDESMKMQQQMMTSMMGNMAGMSPEMKKAMAECPMMKMVPQTQSIK